MKKVLGIWTVGLLAGATVLAGCGGSSPSSSGSSHVNLSYGQRRISASNPANASISASASQLAYTPTGKIVASDGFDPAKNGFDAENYGTLLPSGTGMSQLSNAAPANLTPQNMQQIFGNAVCGDPQCDLTPEAQAWMNQQDQGMANGHCYGFSDAALQFFLGKADPNTFGASSASQLDLLGNQNLQSFIAQNFVYQTLPSVIKNRILADPNTILNDLKKVLVPNPTETYTLIIFMANGGGGHAVTPYAIEDNGGGKFHILIYDNNFPGVTRAIAVDSNSDTWSYTGGINPSDTHELYQGNAQTKNIGLDPTSPALGVQPWAYGGKSSGGASGSSGQRGASGSTGTAARGGGAFPAALNGTPAFLVDNVTGIQYDDVYLNGGDLTHGHLLITNPSGQHVGYLNGTLVNTIPGAIVENTTSNKDWLENKEPNYLVPAGVQYTITIDGTSLTHVDPTEDVGIVAPGYEVAVDNINLNPGETDTMTVTADGSAVTYTASAAQAPIVAYGVSDSTSDYAFAVSGDDIPAGGTINVHLPIGGTAFTVVTSNTGTRTNHVSLLFDKEDDSGSHVFGHGGISLADGDTATLDFGAWAPGQSIPLVVNSSSGTQTIQLTDQGSLSNFGNSGASGVSGVSGASGASGNT